LTQHNFQRTKFAEIVAFCFLLGLKKKFYNE
jgi:hypothetical protein